MQTSVPMLRMLVEAKRDVGKRFAPALHHIAELFVAILVSPPNLYAFPVERNQLR